MSLNLLKGDCHRGATAEQKYVDNNRSSMTVAPKSRKLIRQTSCAGPGAKYSGTVCQLPAQTGMIRTILPLAQAHKHSNTQMIQPMPGNACLRSCSITAASILLIIFVGHKNQSGKSLPMKLPKGDSLAPRNSAGAGVSQRISLQRRGSLPSQPQCRAAHP